jgi:hypothetical protein
MTLFYSPSTKGFYDDELGYASLPDDRIEITPQQHTDLLNGMYKDNKDISCDNGVLSLVNRTIVITWDQVRAKRNNLLTQSDYTQMPDWPGNKTAWTEYRQELRDLPQKQTDPNNITWPTAPGA